MNKTKKIISVLLAIVMVLSIVPVVLAADGEKTENEVRVEGWEANYELYLNTIFDNGNYTSWNYVDQNTNYLNNSMTALTAFALYDQAWQNAFDNSVSVDDAEKILLAIIEKAEYDFDDGYVDEIVKVLETATDINDFLQKVNKYVDIDALSSSGWGTAFEIIGDATYILNAYQNYRDKFIEAYANVLSVQKANAYYLDMLQYIVDNTEYDVLKTAAANLIEDINKSVEDVIAGIVAGAGTDYASIGAEYLVKLAMNSNAYTAVALKVYSIGTSVADVLWNTKDQYVLMDTLKTAYYFQADVSDWAQAALADNADKALIAVDFLMTTRETCENALYDLKLAQSGGIVGKFKSKLYGTVYEDIEVSLASLEIIHAALYDTAVEEFAAPKVCLTIYCPVDVVILDANNNVVYTLADGAEMSVKNAAGTFSSIYSDYAKDYLKVVYLNDNYRVKLVGKAAGTVTLIMDVLNADGTVADWSFTDRFISNKSVLVFDTAFTGTPYYTFSEGETFLKVDFNDKFVPSEYPEVTTGDVVDAVVDVGKEEARSFADMIKAFFESLFGWLKNLFK